MKYFFPFIVLLVSCSGSGSSEKVSDPLAMFPMNREWEFIGVKGNDRIAILLKRTEGNKFTYRVELLRNYYGLPLDYGTVTLKEIEKDSTFNFNGGNDECEMTLRIYKANDGTGDKRAVVERTCNDSTQNILIADFPPLWVKGEAHSH